MTHVKYSQQRFGLTLELTSFCNLRCRHCFNSFEHQDVQAIPGDELLTILDRAFTELHFERLTLSGGEPFSYPGVFQVLELCAARDVRANFVSNATLVTRDIARQLGKFKGVAVQVAINGPRAEVHDAAVGMHGAWERTHLGIERLRFHGVGVIGCIVITHRNAALVGETLDHLQMCGLRAVTLARLLSGGLSASHLDLLPRRGDLLMAFEQASDSRFRDLHLRVAGPIPPCVIDHAAFPTLQFGWCPNGSAGQDFALGPDGKLRSCTIVGHALGNARFCSFSDLILSPEVTKYRKRTPEFCTGCPEQPRCLGGCGAAALATTGDPWALDPLVLQHVDPNFRLRVRTAQARPALEPPATQAQTTRASH